MKRTIFFISVIYVLFSSCHGNRYYSTDVCLLSDKQETGDSIILQTVNEMSSFTRGLLCVDNYLILVQQNRDSIFKIIDSRNDSVVSCFGKVGHSRGEFINIPQKVYCIRGKDGHPLICVQEIMRTKIIDLTKSIECNKCFVKEIIKEDKDFLFYYTYYSPNSSCFNYKTISYEDARDNVYIKPLFYNDGESPKEWDVFPNIITSEFSN